MSDAAAAAAVVSPPKSPLLWGLFCACSWTWCIGMYLPVLLIERFGWNGFLAFAIPNVLGCSAMAFMLRTRERSAELVARHGRMMAIFSLVTVAYQVFFTVWLVGELIPKMSLPWWAPTVVGLVVYLLGLVFAFLSERDWLAVAIVTYVISLAAVFIIGRSGVDRVPLEGSLAPNLLWWLVPTLCFGFLLCPYLDLTFHRAAQASSQPRVTFVIFGVAFAIMLGLTVLLWFNPDVWYRRMAALLAIGHILAQLIFTVGAHLREMRLSAAFTNVRARSLAMALPLCGIGALALARQFLDSAHAGEWAYLSFLACYGLIFPAYVLVAMASRRPLRTSGDWTAFAALLLICIPFYVQGFLFDRTPWLVPPVALFIMWGLLRRRGHIAPGLPGETV